MTLLETKKLEGIGSVQELQQVVQYIKKMANMLVTLSDDLDHVVNGNLDVKNIRAKSIKADRLDVDELSAISANMGTIVAGEITGGSITSNTTITVVTDAKIGNILYLKETDATGQKGIVFSTVLGKSARISVLSGDMSISTDGFITLNIGSSQGLTVNQKVRATSFEALSGSVQANYIGGGTVSAGNGASGTFYAASTAGGANDVEVTVENGIITAII